jgi:WD40 repeat protein
VRKTNSYDVSDHFKRIKHGQTETSRANSWPGLSGNRAFVVRKGPSNPSGGTVQYDAFISYSHEADERLASALELALQRLARPWYQRRGMSIFRDAGNLNLSAYLWGSIQRALNDSGFLIFIASPAAARSPWVSREVEHWRSQRDLTQLIVVLSDGSLTWDADSGDFDAVRSTAIPMCLHGALPGEPFYLDMRWIGPDTDLSLANERFKQQIVQIAAALKGVAVEDIAGEEVEQHRRMIRIRNAAIAGLAGLSLAAVVFAVFAWIQRGAALRAGEEAQRSAEQAQASALVAEQRRGEAQIAREQADASAAVAKENEAVADRERLRAEHEADSAKAALAQASTREAVRLIAEGQRAFALAHLAQAVRLSPRDLAARSWISGFVPDAHTWMALPHQAAVSSASFSADGQRVMTRTADGVLSVWGADTGRLAAAPRTFKLAIRRAAFSPDGRRIVIVAAGRSGANWDGRIITLAGASIAQVLDVGTGEITAALQHQDEITSAEFSRDGTRVVTSSKDKSVRIWEAATGRAIGTALLHPADVRAAMFTPDGRRVVTGSSDGMIRVWDPIGGEIVGPFHDGKRLDHLQLSPDGRRVVAVAFEAAQVFDAGTGESLGPPIRHEKEPITETAFSPDGRLLAVGSIWDSTARVWDYAAGEPVGPLLHPGTAVRSLEFSPDGRWLLSASEDRTARVWEVAKGTQIGAPFQHPDKVVSASFSPDGRRMVTACNDGMARVWDVSSVALAASRSTPESARPGTPSGNASALVFDSSGAGARILDAVSGRLITVPLRYVNALVGAALSPEGRRVVTVVDGAAVVIDARTGHLIGAPMKHEGPVSTIGFTNDWRQIVTASVDKTARVWDAVTGRAIATLRHTDEITSAAFSPDGRFVVAASRDSARIWDVATARTVGAVLQHRQGVNAASFSPDGRRILTASNDYTARLWDATTGRPIGAPLQHDNFVFTASFSPDGRQVVTASADDTARIWDVLTQKPVGAPLRHLMWIYTARFSPDGRRIVTGGMDGTARIWDAATGLPLGPPMAHWGHVRYAEFSADGRAILTRTSLADIVRVWPVLLGTSAGNDGALADLAEVLGGYRLTELGAIAPVTESERQSRVRRLLGGNGSGLTTLDQLLRPLMPVPAASRH